MSRLEKINPKQILKQLRKDRKQRAKNRSKVNFVPTPITIDVIHEVKHSIPMCGWHNNYVDFKSGRAKGTMVFVNGTIGISIDDNSFTFKGQDLIKYCLQEIKKRKKNAKKK